MSIKILLSRAGTTYDLTDRDGVSILQRDSLTVDRSYYGSEFKPVIGTADWEILWDQELMIWLGGQEEDTLVEIEEDLTPLFTGYLRPTTEYPLSGSADKVKMSALDTLVLLESTIEEAEYRWYWGDEMKASMASGINSMVHEFLKRTKFWTGAAWVFPVSAPDRDVLIPLLTIQRGVSAKDKLDDVCLQFGLSYHALPNGGIEFFRWDLPNPASTKTITEIDINRKISVRRKDPKEKGIIVQFQKYNTTVEQLDFLTVDCGDMILGHNEGDIFQTKAIDQTTAKPSVLTGEEFGVIEGYIQVSLKIKLYDHDWWPLPGGSWKTRANTKTLIFNLGLDGSKSGDWHLGVGGQDYDFTTGVTSFSYNQKTRRLQVTIDGSAGRMGDVIRDRETADVDTFPNGQRFEVRLTSVRFRGKARYYEHLEAKSSIETNDDAAPRFRTHPAAGKKLSKELHSDLVADRSVAESTAWARYHNMTASTLEAAMLSPVNLGQVVDFDIQMKGFSSLARVVDLKTKPGSKALPVATFETLGPVTLVHTPQPVVPGEGELTLAPDQQALALELILLSNPSLVVLEEQRWQRAAVKPDRPQQDDPDNWVMNPYDGTDPLWVIRCYRGKNGNMVGQWTDPVQFDGPPGPPGLSTAVVTLYKRTATAGAPTKPTTVSTFTFATGVLAGQDGGWTQTIPGAGGGYLWAITASAVSSTATDTIAAAEWADPNLVSQDGATGATGATGPAGTNAATLFLYQRAAAAPVTSDLGVLTYTFATGALTGTLGAWSKTVPAGSNPLYVITAAAVSAAATDTIAAAEWSAPQILAQNGVTGASGLSTAVVTLYKRTTTSGAPTKPTTVSTFTFATGALTGQDGGWTQTIPGTGGGYLWAITASAASSTATDTISAAEWANPNLVSQDGAAGATGPAGTNAATMFLYQRAAAAPVTSDLGVLTYTFATGALTGTLGAWSKTVPAGSNPLYVITAAAVSAAATDTIAAAEWSAPQILAQNGATGIAPPQDSLVLAITGEDVPPYPDGAAGYVQDAWETLDGWGGNTAQVSADSGILRVPAAANGCFKITGLLPASTIILIIKGLSASHNGAKLDYHDGNGFVYLTSFDLDTEYDKLGFFIPVAHYGVRIRDVPIDMIIDAVYIGDGNYATPPVDSSRSDYRPINVGVVPVPGPGGTALRFGGKSYLKIVTSAFDRVNGQKLSIACIIRPTRVSGNIQILINATKSGVGTNWALYMSETTGYLSLAGAVWYQSAYTPPVGVWTHVEVTVTPAGQNIIKANGAVVYDSGIGGYGFGGTVGELWIGQDAGSPSNFDGDITLPLIWTDYLLTEANTEYLIANNNQLHSLSALTSTRQIKDATEDEILNSNEKQGIIRQHADILTEQTQLDAQATALSVTTQKTAYDTAVSTLTAYLGLQSVPKPWNDVTGTTKVDRGTFRQKFGDVATTKESLKKAITDALDYQSDAAMTAANNANNEAQAAPFKAPVNLGRYKDTFPTATNVGDLCTRYSETIGPTNRGVFRWNGVGWDRTELAKYVRQVTTDISFIIMKKNTDGVAIYGTAADYAGDSTLQADFLFAQEAFVGFLEAMNIRVRGSLVIGGRYNFDGTIADPKVSGTYFPKSGLGKTAGLTFEGSLGGGVQWGGAFQVGNSSPVISGLIFPSLCVLSPTIVVVGGVVGGSGQVTAHAFTGRDWVAKTPFPISCSGVAALTETDIVVVGNWQVLVLRLSGSTFAQVGSTFPLTNARRVCRLSSTHVVVLVEDDLVAANDYLVLLTFNGSAFSQVGAPYPLGTGGSRFAMCARNGTDIAIVRANNSTLRVLRFNLTDGTVAQQGNTYPYTSAGYVAMDFLNGTDLCIIDSEHDQLQILRWDESDFSLMASPGGTGVATAGPAMAAMDGASVAYVDESSKVLRKFAFSFSLSRPWSYPFTG